ncbi:hypothetical protein [Kordia sp.]|uniref:hypothetical protein n=1 Tax=Kordia sp. TaxID=1965332 RepID=UPI003D278C14
MKDLEILKKIIGLTFKKGKDDNPETTNKTELSKKIADHPIVKNTLTYKSLLNYFNYFFLDLGKQTTPSNDSIDALLRYINFQSYKQFLENSPSIDFEKDVPFIDKKELEKSSHKERKNDDEIIASESDQKNPESTNKFSVVALVSIVAIVVALVSIVALSINNKGDNPLQEKTTQPHITINTKDIIVSDLNRVIPDENTPFFDSKNQPKVWYAHYKGTLEFYNTLGVHPKTNEVLKPVTREIIKTIFVEKNTKIPVKPYLLNTSLKNIPEQKQLSVMIVDSLYTVERDVTNIIQEQYGKKGYTITASLIPKAKLSEDIVTHLQALDKNYFKADLNTYIDYLCIGKVDYVFSKSTVIVSRIACTLTINYTLFSTSTREVMGSYSKTVYGNGTTKNKAKNNTLNKLKNEKNLF